MILALVQARMSSSRLPGKVLRPIAERPLLAYLVDRLRCARRIDVIAIATGDLPANEPILEFGRQYEVPVHVGSESDVPSRFATALDRWNADAIVRITADCPLVDPLVVDACVSRFLAGKGQLAYVTNAPISNRRIVQGADVEVFSRETILALTELKDPFWREWFTPYVQEHPDRFPAAYETPGEDLSRFRVTVDYPEDLKVVEAVLLHFGEWGRFPHMPDIIEFLGSRPDLVALTEAYRGSSVQRYRAALDLRMESRRKAASMSWGKADRTAPSDGA